MSQTLAQEEERIDPRRRVHSRVALSLLEALRDQDLPEEVLDDENLAVTLPRRLGLSGVVDTQIRRYREDARRRRRVPDREVQDLMKLVVRRPDSRQVFLRVGEDLHGDPGGRPGWRRLLPQRIAHRLALRRVRQRLRVLFGRPVLVLTGSSAAASPYSLVAIDDIFIRSDAGGDACAIVTGISRIEMRRTGRDPDRLVHLNCRARGDDGCEWGFVDPDPGADGTGRGNAAGASAERFQTTGDLPG